jgi:hypothetical protein
MNKEIKFIEQGAKLLDALLILANSPARIEQLKKKLRRTKKPVQTPEETQEQYTGETFYIGI